MGRHAAERPTLFLVEDEEDTANLISMIMGKQGYHIVHAADGRQGLRLIKSIPPPSLVLLDILLPYVDGVKLLNHIRRARPDWEDVPVVMLSAVNSARDIREAVTLGANDYILKPFQQEALVARLQRFRFQGSAKPDP